MGDSISVGVSGLVSYQRAIATISNNIANVNTPGYSRQIPVFGPLPSQNFGSGYIGGGVELSNVIRSTNQFVNAQLRSSQSNFSYLEAFNGHASQIDSLLVQDGTNVTSGLQGFYTALDLVNESPSDITVREAFFSQTNLLTDRFQGVYNQIQNQTSQINLQVRSMVSEVNRLTQNIADINKKVIGSGEGGAPDLLDLRDHLINELSQYVNITTQVQNNGAMNVTLGGGQVLVINTDNVALAAATNAADAANLDIVLAESTNTIITSAVTGGELGGVLEFRDQMMLPTLNTVGLIALGIADSFNKQNALGMDLDGNIGGDIFANINDSAKQLARSLGDSTNTGTAVLSVEIDEVASLTTSDYLLTANTGPSYTLTRLSDDTSTTFASFPQTIDGMTIDIDSGALAVGDKFTLIPTRNAADDFNLITANSRSLAVSSPIRTIQSTANTGTGLIDDGVVIDTSNAAFTTTPGQLTPPIRVEFLSGTSYQLVNATTSAVIEGPIAFTPGTSQAIFPTPGSIDYGYRINLSGTPETGDSFTINYNSGGFSDNRNGQALVALQSQKLLENDNTTFQDVYAGLIADVGGKTAHSDANMEAGRVLLDQAQANRDAELGVNLDEEAAELLKLQQAYQAAGQVVSISSRLFDILFQTLGV